MNGVDDDPIGRRAHAVKTAKRMAIASRRAQGLPDRITDPAVIARIAALLSTGGAKPLHAARHSGSEADEGH